MGPVMRPVLVIALVLLALPASASAQTPLPPLDYAAPTASIARGMPLTFAVRTPAPDGSINVRVSGSDELGADGLLTGPAGSYLDEPATHATPEIAIWSVPDDSVLRRRPGHYYWQAYLTGDAANGAQEPIGPVRELTITLPRADKGRGKLFPKFGHKGVRRFYLSAEKLPENVARARFQKLARAAAKRWGLKALRWTSAKAGVNDGFSVAGFSTKIDDGVLGLQTDYVKGGKVVESDLALNASENWNAGPDYPALDQVDLESVVLHELGHMAGNKKHRARCTNSPMVEALAAGEWWRGSRDKWFGDCGASASSVGRKTFLHRVIRID
jgi:hypothetical protein